MILGFYVFSTVVSRYGVLDVLTLDTNEKKNCQKNAKARNDIIAALSDNEMIKFMHCRSTRGVWDKLENSYEGYKKVNKVKLRTYRMRFESFKMKEDEIIEKYFQRVETMNNLIKRIDAKYWRNFLEFLLLMRCVL